MKEIPGEPNTETTIELLASKNHQGLYALKPLTGKKHQLRVQMASLGIPIINDHIYPCHQPEALDEASIQRMYKKPLQLLAKSISFIDPLSGQLKEYTSQQKLFL